ncbi:MAG: ATP-dependent helicase [Calditrichaeota bacterium]|nr:MAG: ATP-dependent helicase [Calditrichota bacterium]
MEKLAKFAELGISDNILQALKKKGFEEPTPIQARIIPIILDSDKDLVGQAQTGTGKTAAFGIPILEKIQNNSKNVQAIILTPTRELAIQVSEEINSLKGKKRFQVVPIYGGQSIEIQINRLKRGVDIVVGTPGRIKDHLRRRTLDLSEVSFAVLDEADEMLNMGFIEDVEEILEATNEDRTTLLFSATMPREIKQVAKKYMREYELVAVKAEQITTELTDQIYFEVSRSDKFEALCRIIDIEAEFYGIIFCRTKVDVDNITNNLSDRGYEAEGLHGDISQFQREKILNKFKKKRSNILVATDVAARGIDVNDLSHVINYAIPQDPDSYVHRIGRTGRAGKEGTAITFITPDEYRKLRFIQKIAKTDIRKEQLPRAKEVINAKKERLKNEIEEIAQTVIAKEFYDLAESLLSNLEPETALASVLKHTFKDELNVENYNDIRDSYPQIKGKTRLFVAKGKKDNLSKRDLVDFICQSSGVDQRKIQDVQLFEIYSFVTVPFQEAERIIDSFKSTGRRKPLVEMAQKRGSGGSSDRGESNRSSSRRSSGGDFKRSRSNHSGGGDSNRSGGKKRTNRKYRSN